MEPGETPEVDLNQPSGSYERELEERGEGAEPPASEAAEDTEDAEDADAADDGASDDA